MAKKLSFEEIVDRARTNGLASLTNAQLGQVAGRGSDSDKAKVKEVLDTRLKIARINKTSQQPRRRVQPPPSTTAPVNDEWLSAQEARIMQLSDEDAQAELSMQMSPVQNDLIMLYRLRRIVDKGGRAGSEAGRLILEMQRRYVAPVRKTAIVKIQTVG